MKQDRFLIGILAFIGLLVVAALVLFFVRNTPPSYGPEDTPQGVLYNYVVALQLGDYERAYGYLADEEDKPGYDTFRQAFLIDQLGTSTAALQIGAVRSQEGGQALVDVTVQYAGSGIFDNGWTSSDRAVLEQQGGAWKISYMPSPYWGWDWYQPVVVPAK